MVNPVLGMSDPVSNIVNKDKSIPQPPPFNPIPTPNIQKDIAARQKFVAPMQKQETEMATQIGKFEGQKELEKVQQSQIESEAATAGLKKYAKAMEMPDFEAKRKELEDKMEKPFVPTQDSTKDIAQLFSLINIVGFAFGAGGKGNSQAAMSAMNGMMEGHIQGRADLYKKEKDVFDESMKQLKTRWDSLMKDMDKAKDMAKTNLELATQEGKLAAAKHGASFISQNIEKFGLMYGYEQAKRGNDAMTTAYDKATDHVRTISEKNAEIRTNYDKMIWETQMKAYEKQLKSTGDIGDVPEYIRRFTGSTPNKKDAPEIMTAANAFGDAYALIQTVTEHPEWVGRTGQMKNVFNRYIVSMNTGGPEPDDMGQPELIFAKRYAEYLVNYERALAGGAKGFTVQFQKRFNALLDQNQFDAAGFKNLMNEQLRTITSKAAEKGPTINRQNLTRMAFDMKVRAEDDMAVKGMTYALTGGDSTEKETPSSADIAYAKAHPEVHDKFVKKFGREP